MTGPGSLALTQCHPQDKEAGMQVARCCWEPATWRSTAHKLLPCLSVLIKGPQNIFPSVGQDTEIWRCSWGHWGNHFRPRDPLECGLQVSVIWPQRVPSSVSLPGPCKLFYLSLCCRKSLQGQTACLQPVSLRAHKAEINEWRLGKRQGIGQQLF